MNAKSLEHAAWLRSPITQERLEVIEVLRENAQRAAENFALESKATESMLSSARAHTFRRVLETLRAGETTITTTSEKV